MSIRPILRIGNPRLREVSLPVEVFDSPTLHRLIADMRDTMIAADGAGLAAPQIGVALRIVLFGLENNPRYPDEEEVPQTVLINPQLMIMSSEERGGWEGCLSVPGMRGYVQRPAHIAYRGFDQFGQAIERVASGFHATVVQHEVDHLDGVLYPDLITDMTRYGFVDELVAAGALPPVSED